MSRAPTSAPHRRRPHLRLVQPVAQHPAAVTSRRGHLPHPRRAGVTALDAVAVMAALYVAVLLLRFLPW